MPIDRTAFPPLSAEERGGVERLAVDRLAGTGTAFTDARLLGMLEEAEARAAKAEGSLEALSVLVGTEHADDYESIRAGVNRLRSRLVVVADQRDRLLAERRDLAASIQALPFTPDTHTGTRQAAAAGGLATQRRDSRKEDRMRAMWCRLMHRAKWRVELALAHTLVAGWWCPLCKKWRRP